MIFGVSKLSEERPQLWVALKERQCSEMLLVEGNERMTSSQELRMNNLVVVRGTTRLAVELRRRCEPDATCSGSTCFP